MNATAGHAEISAPSSPYPAPKAIWFQDHPVGAHTRILLTTYTSGGHHGGGRVTDLESCPAAGTFGDFAGREGESILRHLVSAGCCMPFRCNVSAMLTLAPVRSP
jgi:hypothetical protein